MPWLDATGLRAHISDSKANIASSDNSDKETDVSSADEVDAISSVCSTSDEEWCSTPQVTPRWMPRDAATRSGSHEVVSMHRRTNVRARATLRRTGLNVLAMVRFRRALRAVTKSVDEKPRVSLRRTTLGVLAMIRMRRAVTIGTSTCPVKFAHLNFASAVVTRNTFIDFENSCAIGNAAGLRRTRSYYF